MADHQIDHAFFERMLRDNEKLRELLGQVTRVFAGGLQNADRVVESMSSLATQLEAHFDDEEGTGVFDVVVEWAPRLAERVDEFWEQHNELRNDLAAINQRASSGDRTVEWWNDLSKAFHDFSKDLMHHETSENQVVQEAYTLDIGVKD